MRFAFVAYLYLAKLIKLHPEDFSGNKSVMSALEQAIIDIELRQKITANVEQVLNWLSPQKSPQ